MFGRVLPILSGIERRYDCFISHRDFLKLLINRYNVLARKTETIIIILFNLTIRERIMNNNILILS